MDGNCSWAIMHLLVSKSALGRGLGKLLGGKAHGSPKADSASKTPGMSPGVARLFQGGKSTAESAGREARSGKSTAESAKGEAQGGERIRLRRGFGATEGGERGEGTNHQEERGVEGRKVKRVIRVSLVAGDVSILGLVAWVLLDSGRPLTSLEILIGVLAVATGAWLACLALYLD